MGVGSCSGDLSSASQRTGRVKNEVEADEFSRRPPVAIMLQSTMEARESWRTFVMIKVSRSEEQSTCTERSS